MRAKTKKNLKTGIIVLLILIAAILAYMYFVMLKSGGGIVSATKNKVGKIESIFSVYGPGRGKMPRFTKPLAVAVDSENNFYVSDTGNNRICVFDRNGEFLFEFGSFGVAKPQNGEKATWEPGKFSFPYAIDIDDQTGNIFVGDMINGRIQKFTKEGKFLDWFPKDLVKTKSHATDLYPLAIDVKDGKVYVTNPFQVMIFDVNGKYIDSFGMPGKKEGQLDRPNGIAVGDDGSIYVSDSNNLRIQAFDPKGKFKWVVGKPVVQDGSMPKQDKDRVFGLPRNMRIGNDGNIYVIDGFDFRIKVFTPQGKMVGSMGQRGVDDGYFNFPNGIAIAKDGTFYIADKENDRVQAIRLTGLEIEE